MSKPQETLQINHEERRFLGVCAGIADYLDMPVTLIRVIFVISILTWPTLILAYLCLYFCLDRNITSEKVQDFFSNNNPTEHLKNIDFRRPIYRNMRNRKIAGVCSGLADYFEISPLTVRVLAVVSLFILGPYAVLAYIIGWFAMRPNPARRPGNGRSHRRHFRGHRRRKRGMSASRINDPDHVEVQLRFEKDDAPADDGDMDTADKNASSNGSYSNFTENLEECADVYYTLESRLREIEAFMTSKKFRLHCEINRI